jgi:hypothetical protein
VANEIDELDVGHYTGYRGIEREHKRIKNRPKKW